MMRFLLRRTLAGLGVLFVFVSLVFFGFQLILPGDFVSQMYWLAPEAKQTLRLQLGLHLPLAQRYLVWMGNLLRGDLGISFTSLGPAASPPVSEVLAGVIPPTLLVFGLGTLLAFLLGSWLGRVTVWARPGPVTGMMTLCSIMLHTAFPPWLGFLVSYVVIRRLELLPGAGVYSIDLWWHAPISRPEAIMGLLLRAVIVSGVVVAASRLVYRLRRVTIPEPLAIALAGVGWVASWLPGGFWPYAVDIMKQAAVPLTVFTLLSFGEIVLITRASMIDTLHEDYILTAFAKGLPESTIRDRHAARNALGPVLSRLLVSLPYLLTGVVMIEYALKWEGVGTALFYAFGRQNVSLAMGALIVVAVISLVTRIVLDTLVAALDPRIRFGVQRTGVSP